MKGKLIVAGVLAAVLAVGCGGGKKADQPVAASAPQTAPSGGGQAAGAAADGTYTIVGQESTASYSVHEKFLKQNLPAVAVGKTSVITGGLVFAKGAIQPSKVTVDVSTLKSDKNQRDREIKTRGLESSKYPTAEFSITGVDGTVPAIAGQEAAFKLKGNLKVHGVEKPVVWDAKAHTEGDTVKLTATVNFKMSLFNITPPSEFGLIEVDDNVQLDVNLAAKKN